jgi:hypothetical protein
MVCVYVCEWECAYQNGRCNTMSRSHEPLLHKHTHTQTHTHTHTHRRKSSEKQGAVEKVQGSAPPPAFPSNTIHTLTCMGAHILAYIHIHAWVRIYSRVYMHTYMHTYTHTCMGAHKLACIHVYTLRGTSTHKQTHTNTYLLMTHTHTRAHLVLVVPPFQPRTCAQ